MRTAVLLAQAPKMDQKQIPIIIPGSATVILLGIPPANRIPILCPQPSLPAFASLIGQLVHD